MANKWISGKLGDLIQLQRGFDLPEYQREYGDVPVVTSAGVSGTHSTAKVKGPGVVMGRYGTLGNIYYIDRDFWPHNTTLFVKDFGGNDPLFLAYFLRTLHFSAHSDKSSVPGLNRNDLHTISVTLPPLAEQREIAAILGSLDDKIDLNRRMNATLEATARALFKSWFVDFDPVRAKSEGRDPDGMDAETAALFPDAFEESELGPIPQGWRVEPLSRHIKASKGLSYKGTGLTDADDGQPMHNLNSVYEGGGYKYDGIKYYSGEYQGRHLAYAGDLIVTNTEQGHDLLLIGYPALIPTRYPEGLYTHHLYRVTPLPDTWITARFLYFLMRTDYFHDVIGGYTNGTTVNMLPVDGLQRPLFVVPSADVTDRFDGIVLPLLAKMEANHEQSERLAETRDALLPRLVSGQVRTSP